MSGEGGSQTRGLSKRIAKQNDIKMLEFKNKKGMNLFLAKIRIIPFIY